MKITELYFFQKALVLGCESTKFDKKNCVKLVQTFETNKEMNRMSIIMNYLDQPCYDSIPPTLVGAKLDLFEPKHFFFNIFKSVSMTQQTNQVSPQQAEAQVESSFLDGQDFFTG